jgi:hypothetical protein
MGAPTGPQVNGIVGKIGWQVKVGHDLVSELR